MMISEGDGDVFSNGTDENSGFIAISVTTSSSDEVIVNMNIHSYGLENASYGGYSGVIIWSSSTHFLFEKDGQTFLISISSNLNDEYFSKIIG